ncbi:hypothetical protein [Streptomyces sp. NPDC052012]|uniref:hypothetical protein n=1 Tax=Streptomyces sp. NPDC052012 TaxID=3155051 RepID=UPI00344E4F01
MSTTQSISGTSSTVRRFGGAPLDDFPYRTASEPNCPNCGLFRCRRKSTRSTMEDSVRRVP